MQKRRVGHAIVPNHALARPGDLRFFCRRQNKRLDFAVARVIACIEAPAVIKKILTHLKQSAPSAAAIQLPQRRTPRGGGLLDLDSLPIFAISDLLDVESRIEAADTEARVLLELFKVLIVATVIKTFVTMRARVFRSHGSRIDSTIPSASGNEFAATWKGQ